MKNSKRNTKKFLVVLMVLLPGLFLVGCRGNLGWDRMDAPVGRQSHTSYHQAG